jgi:aminoglycoside phosphotransferase
VIPFPPRDPVLGDLDVVLSGSAMIEVLGRHLPDCASGALRVESCHPVAVRYEPGRSCLVRYKLALRDDRAGPKIKTLAQVELSASNLAEELWSDPTLGRLVERAAKWHPDPPVGRAAYVPEMRAIVQLYPVDVKLPALVPATSSCEMCRVLREAFPEKTGSAPRECHAELVRYKPAKRAVLRYRLGGAEVDTVYGKLHARDRAAALYEIGRALREAGVATPAPLAYLPDLRMVVYSEAQGGRLKDLYATDEFAGWMGPVAEALAHLHATRIDGLPIGSSHDEARTVLVAGRMIETLLPNQATEAARLATNLAADLAAVQVPAVTIHGDFSAQQVLISDASVVLLDFDRIKLGNPLLDVATFLADLSVRQNESTSTARAMFLDAYAALRPDVREHILLFEAAKLFKAAVGPFRRPTPDWPTESEHLMRLATQRLKEHRGRSLPPAARRQTLHRQNRRRPPEHQKTGS